MLRRRKMKGQIRAIGKALAILCAAASLSFAQVGGLSGNVQSAAVQNSGPMAAPEQPSAGPGTLNYVEGQVSLNGNSLSARSIGNAALQRGGALDTGEGYAE